MQITLIPTSAFKRYGPFGIDARHVNVLVSGTILILLFSWHDGLRYITGLPHICLFEYVLGIPCPGCDITAALVKLAGLDVYGSLLTQPCAVVLVVTFFGQLIVSAAHVSQHLDLNAANKSARALGNVFVSVLLLFWFYRLFVFLT